MTLATSTDLRKLEVRDRGGDRIGQVEDLGVEIESGQARYVLVKDGGLLRDRVYIIPLERFIYRGEWLQLDASREQLKGAPSFGVPGNPKLDRETEEKVYGHWGQQPYWETPGYLVHQRRAGEVMHAADEVAVRQDEPLDRVAALMAQRDVDRVPVVDQDGHFVGFVTAREVLAVWTPRRPAPGSAEPAAPAGLERGSLRDRKDERREEPEGGEAAEPMAAAREADRPMGEPMPGSAPAPEAAEEREGGSGASARPEERGEDRG